MIPVLWARVIPWDKEIAIAALESGIDVLWIPDGSSDRAKELGRVRTVCAEGDFREGRDFRVTGMEGKRDEAAVLSSPPDTLWVVSSKEREVIPLENLVAWRRKASRTSSRLIPSPSSVTRMRVRPPSLISTTMCRPPASRLFSTSSLTTAAGRSITSPAAIRLTTSPGKT